MATKKKSTTAAATTTATSTTATSTVAVTTPDWYDLLQEAVREPGAISAAYKFFNQYSLANRWLASTQLRARGLPLTPINTFKGWLGVDRPVQKGEKASIALVMPVPTKTKSTDPETGEKEEKVFNRFILRNYWFHMGQTDGAEYVPPDVDSKEWSVTSALATLDIQERPYAFADVSDTQLGRAEGRVISVSPLDTYQVYGRLREAARVMLGHTAETPTKSVPDTAQLREVEAEAAAYLCAATLGIPGIEEGRLRLQLALDETTSKTRIPDKLANRAFSTADKLLNAGWC